MSDLILRVNTLQGCARIDFDTGGSISASVGVGGRNVPEDVRTVQALLNSIPPAKGGPNPLLDVDGLVGPKTIAAIRKFQQSQLGFNDGRVDPGAKTISKLDELQASAGALKSSIAAVPGPIPIPPGLVSGVKRLATANAVIGDIRQAIEKAIFNLDLAIHKAANVPEQVLPSGASLNLLGASETRATILVDRHFGMGRLSQSQRLSQLTHIRTTCQRMKIIYERLHGVSIGDSIFELDPTHKPANVAAYIVPKHEQKSAKKRGLSVGKIYLCAALDPKPRDQYTFTILHELAHHVSDEEKTTDIIDHAYAFEKKYDLLTFFQRIHNAECYAAFAFESAMGNQRLAALYPLLRVIELDVVNI